MVIKRKSFKNFYFTWKFWSLDQSIDYYHISFRRDSSRQNTGPYFPVATAMNSKCTNSNTQIAPRHFQRETYGNVTQIMFAFIQNSLRKNSL